MTPHFYTHQLQTTIDYYTTVLLFELVLHPGDLSDSSCMLRFGDDCIIFEETKTAVDHCSWGKLHFYVENVEQTFQRISDFADVKSQPEWTGSDTIEFTVRDCNEIELVFSQVRASMTMDSAEDLASVTKAAG